MTSNALLRRSPAILTDTATAAKAKAAIAACGAPATTYYYAATTAYSSENGFCSFAQLTGVGSSQVCSCCQSDPPNSTADVGATYCVCSSPVAHGLDHHGAPAQHPTVRILSILCSLSAGSGSHERLRMCQHGLRCPGAVRLKHGGSSYCCSDRRRNPETPEGQHIVVHRQDRFRHQMPPVNQSV